MDITKRLEIKSNMIFLGEKIAFGSECALMDEAIIEITKLRNRVKELEAANKLLEADAKRYRWLSEQNAELELDSFVVLSHDSTVEEGWQKYWVGSDLNKAIDEAMENNNDNS